MLARLRPLIQRATREGGFGFVELMIAITILVIGLLAVFAMFQTGILAIKRASTVATASSLADREMENFRAIRTNQIGLVDAQVTSAAAPYSSDPAYQTNSANRVNLPACGSPPCTTKVPVQTLTGADGKNYRVDTYVTWQTVTGGRTVKLVTIVVRDAATTSKTWARLASSFDDSTGQ